MGDLSRNFSKSEFACRCCGKTEIDQRLVDALQELRDLALETPGSICRDLERRGAPTRRGGPWTSSGIRGLLISPTYAGLIPIYRGREGGKSTYRHVGYDRLTTLPGRHAPLIDMETWERARDLALPRSHSTASPWADRPLSGLVRCGLCGRRCNVVGALPRLYYRCRPYGTVGCESKANVRIDRLEVAVRGWAMSLARDARAIEAAALMIQAAELETARVAAEARGPLESAVREIQARQERLLQAVMLGGQSPHLLVERLRQEEAALAAAKDRLAAVGSTVKPAPLATVKATIRRHLAAGGQDLRRLRPLIDRIDLPEDRDLLPVLHALGGQFPMLLPLRGRGRAPA